MTTDTRPRRLFGLLCAHSWQDTDRLPRMRNSDSPSYLPAAHRTGAVIVGYTFLMRCEHCGDRRRVDL